MPSSPVAPGLFLIRAVSPKPQKPDSENYIVLTRLNDGSWTTSPKGLSGIFAVRGFLKDNGIEAKRIAAAVEELNRTRETRVSAYFLKSTPIASPKLRWVV
jgi:hypothetical protein